jgi:hypothetical protein
MKAFFKDGKIKMGESIGNVMVVYYPVNDKDSSLIGLNYTETDTMRMYMSPERTLQRIWMSKATGTLYPMTQIPPSKTQLPNFAWFDYIRPIDKDDIFKWRGKKVGQELKAIQRHAAPLQNFSGSQSKGASR